MTTKLSRLRSNMITAFEEQYRRSTVEHAMLLNSFGDIVVVHTGDDDEVKFTVSELERACAGMLTHNHPRCLPPSMNDLAIAAKYGLTLRAVGVTPENECINYVVNFVTPSEDIAAQIRRHYDNEVEKAEVELARRDWDDYEWERKARHLAVTRLAEKLGFVYECNQKHVNTTSVAEIRNLSPEERRLDLLEDVANVIDREVLRPIYIQLERLILRNVNSKGVVPIERMMAVRREAELIVTYAMLGKPAQDGTLSPYKIHHGGHIVADSPYFAALWRLVRTAASLAADYHADMMRKHMPADVQRHFEMAAINPFSDRISEMDDDSVPKLVYDPLRRWLDGKTLSDRIWNTTGDMRAKLDNYLAAAISTGKSISQMTSELQPFLLSGKGAYEAMRLARTEVAAAYSLADYTSAQLNPFVESYTPYTAPQHGCCDNCDVEEANGPYPKSDPKHLPPFHPLCICGVRWNQVERIPSTVERLRLQIAKGLSATRRSVADLVGPLSKRFIDFMFGERK